MGFTAGPAAANLVNVLPFGLQRTSLDFVNVFELKDTPNTNAFNPVFY